MDALTRGGLGARTVRSGASRTTKTLLSDADALHRRLVRLAYDVHDGPMQNLTSVGYSVRELKRRLDASRVDPATVSSELERILHDLAGTESGLRTLISRLEHVYPEIESVDEILAEELENFARRCPVQVEIDAPTDVRLDSHSQSLAVRSVVRETLNNVAKHADAEHVRIRVQAGPDGVLLEIEDDGCGFDPDDVGAAALGLASMSERVGLLGGEFAVLSRVGGPTVVTAHLQRWHG